MTILPLHPTVSAEICRSEPQFLGFRVPLICPYSGGSLRLTAPLALIQWGSRPRHPLVRMGNVRSQTEPEIRRFRSKTAEIQRPEHRRGRPAFPPRSSGHDIRRASLRSSHWSPSRSHSDGVLLPKSPGRRSAQNVVAEDPPKILSLKTPQQL